MLTFSKICKHDPFIVKLSVTARVYIHAPNRLQVGNFEHTASDAHRKPHPPPYEQTSPMRIPLQNEIRAWVDNFKQITVFCHPTPRARRHKTSESVHRNRISLTILQGVFLIGPNRFANLWRRLKKITVFCHAKTRAHSQETSESVHRNCIFLKPLSRVFANSCRRLKQSLH